MNLLLQHPHPLISTHITALIFFIILCAAASAPPLYEEYCSYESEADEPGNNEEDMPSSPSNFAFHNGYFTGGSPLFSAGKPASASSFHLLRHGNTAVFTTRNVSMTSPHRQGHEFSAMVEGSLILQSQSVMQSNNNNNISSSMTAMRVFHSGFRGGGHVQPMSVHSSNMIKLRLTGIWLPGSRTLYMSACFDEDHTHNRKDCKVKAIIRYASKEGNTIQRPFLTGKLESKRKVSDPLFFNPVVFIAMSENPYVFTISSSPCAVDMDVGKSIEVWKDDEALCRFPWYKQPLDIVWNHSQHCSSLASICSPFRDMAISHKGVGASHEVTLSIQNMACAEEKVHGLFIFHHKANGVIIASEVLSIEGTWNVAKGQLCASACYLKGITNGSMEYESKDCDIIITLQFPTTLELLFRYSVIGHVKRRENSEFPFFSSFQFTAHMDITYGPLGWMVSPPQLEYSYSIDRIKQAQNMCHREQSEGWMSKNMKRQSNSEYPNGRIFSDLGFSATVVDPLEGVSSLYFSPIAINRRTNRNLYRGMAIITSPVPLGFSRSMNISFELSLEINERSNKLFPNTLSMRFPAEGIYDGRTGILCLIACRRVADSNHNTSKLDEGNKDCQIHITVQYPPINPGYFGNHRITGKIISLREQNDGLYFSPKALTSDLILYQEQAANAIIQIDVEVVIQVFSLTVEALLVGVQLRYVKRNPKVLPHVSLLMLSLLMLGYLIPLVWNFEAIFSTKSRQNILQSSGGWLEIVSLMTMAAFPLLLWLLHLVWFAKRETDRKGARRSEQGVLRICLVFYGIGSLLACIVDGASNIDVFGMIKALAGLSIHFFLFPQIVGNYLWNVQDVVLLPSFYCGMTVVRSLPHLYSIVKRFELFAMKSRRCFYATPDWDFGSDAWDGAIPCISLSCVLLIFLQQRYGGVAFLRIPLLAKSISYEVVTVKPSS